MWANRLSAPDHADQKTFLKQLVGLRKAARKFLGYGWLQRPVHVLHDVPLLDLNDAKGRPVQSPAVLATAWAAHHGILGFVFCNTSADAQEVRWQADLSRHEIDGAACYGLTVIQPDGTRTDAGELEGALLERTEEMPPHSAFILEVAAVR